MREGGNIDGGVDSGSEGSVDSTDRPHPPSFYCPISRQCMHDPVILTDGHTYERQHIMKWLRNNSSSPFTGMTLESKVLIPNHTLRNAIEEYFEHVLGTHRQAVRQATARLAGEARFSNDDALRQTIDSLMQCSILINADLSVDLVLTRIMTEAKALLGAEVASVFLVDKETRELYSSVNSTGGELRIPMNSGVAGRVALSGSALICNDAYSDPRFNTVVDAETGFRTRNILCVPIRSSRGRILGVAQLINKTDSGILKFTQSGEEPRTVTENENYPLNFTSDDLQFFQVLASQAGAAVDNSGLFDCVPQDVSLWKSRLVSSSTIDPKQHYLGCSSRNTGVKPKSRFLRFASDRVKEVQGGDGRRRGQLSRAQADPTLGGDSPMKIGEKTISSLNDREDVRQVLLNAFGSWEMDVFALEELTDGRPLSSLARFIFEKTGLITRFDMNRSKLDNFLMEIERGYPETNQYHSRAHAASVLHILHALLHLGGLAEAASVAVAGIEDADTRRGIVTMSALLAAIVHDYEHTGVNNDFLVKTCDFKALLYNDRSPNENHHVAAAFALLIRPECSFLECLSVGEFAQVRKLVINLVLATDMAGNGQVLSAFKHAVGIGAVLDVSGDEPASTPENSGDRSSQSGFSPASPEDGLLTLQMALKCADLGHLSLSWAAHLRWVRLLEAEFFAQGDQEKSMGFAQVSFLMDREHPGVTQSQVGFLEFVALPLFRCLAFAFPASSHVSVAVENNYLRWREREAFAM
eukprot:TRINITY_DN230_c0_g1_i1.p1 TRINITY_DN230_c0_g1~~TRINITY_DN230_c0_g1_i1.p1  ORF type:complete len:792 (+),score=108.52 TRINITY_DN230_c0_g1_i1:116-2377(+)